MQLTPDSIVVGRWGPLVLHATVLFSWLTMGLLAGGAWWIGRRLRVGPQISRLQAFLEVVVVGLCRQIEEIARQDPEPYLPFIGSLFLFILSSNLLTILPGYAPPTGSLSTTTALAICVFVAVPIYGIRAIGIREYLRSYLKPTPLMAPFLIIGEFSRTVALAMRLFGNIMSGTLLTAILLSIVPLFVPAVMQLMGLVFGVIQAYVFAVLALVYISSAASIQQESRGLRASRPAPAAAEAAATPPQRAIPHE